MNLRNLFAFTEENNHLCISFNGDDEHRQELLEEAKERGFYDLEREAYSENDIRLLDNSEIGALTDGDIVDTGNGIYLDTYYAIRSWMENALNGRECYFVKVADDIKEELYHENPI